jgi:hypothetical protein
VFFSTLVHLHTKDNTDAAYHRIRLSPPKLYFIGYHDNINNICQEKNTTSDGAQLSHDDAKRASFSTTTKEGVKIKLQR